MRPPSAANPPPHPYWSFSLRITDPRLPGKGTGFSANGLTSSSLGRLGRLMPTKASAQPASVKTHKSETPTAPSPLPSLPTLPLMLAPIGDVSVSLRCLGRRFCFWFRLALIRRRLLLRSRYAGTCKGCTCQFRLGEHGQHHTGPPTDARRRIAIAQEPLELGARFVGLSGLLR